MTSTALFSSTWYRVAGLRPRLRSHTRIHHHQYRNEPWYLIQDHITGRFHRFTPETYAVIGLMDGSRTLDQIWDIACEKLGDDMPSQDEVIRLLGQLHRADVIQANLPPDMTELHRRQVKQKRARLLARLRSPLAIKIPLWDPDSFLDKTDWLAKLLFSPLGWAVWLVSVTMALLLAGVHWDSLTGNLADRVLALENVLLLWLVYPVVKGIHELGHGYAIKRHGGEVHELGIMFLVFIPVPYVEASSSYAFANKYHRMLVGGAGILTELFLAAIAMMVWVMIEPGAVRALAFNVMVISGVSTLLFNGNPLLRFDAYYVLSDFLEIPNLGMKSNKQLGHMLKYYLLGIQNEAPPARSAREAAWLVFYSVAAFCYRMIIMLTIALFVAGKFFIVGMLLALWSLYGFLLHPLFKTIKAMSMDSEIRKHKTRLTTVVSIFLLAILIMLFWLPLPKKTVAEAVTWVPGEYRIVSGAAGMITRLTVTDGQLVQAGDLLLVMEDDELNSRVQVIQSRLDELAARRRIAQSDNELTASDIIEKEIERIEQQHQRLVDQQQSLKLYSPGNGIFHFSIPDNLVGRFVGRGEEIGYLLPPGQYLARVLVDQSDIDAVRNDVQQVSVRFAESIDSEFKADILREIPGAHHQLPSLALSVEGGGRFALDPSSQDQARAFDAFFQYELSLESVPAWRLGERLYVRFEHTPEPIGYRWIREMRRVLLERLDL